MQKYRTIGAQKKKKTAWKTVTFRYFLFSLLRVHSTWSNDSNKKVPWEKVQVDVMWTQDCIKRQCHRTRPTPIILFRRLNTFLQCVRCRQAPTYLKNNLEQHFPNLIRQFIESNKTLNNCFYAVTSTQHSTTQTNRIKKENQQQPNSFRFHHIHPCT